MEFRSDVRMGFHDPLGTHSSTPSHQYGHQYMIRKISCELKN